MSLSDNNIFYLFNLISSSSNYQIKKVDLSNNNYLTEKSIEYLIKFLEKNKDIEKIEFNYIDKINVEMNSKLNDKLLNNVNFLKFYINVILILYLYFILIPILFFFSYV